MKMEFTVIHTAEHDNIIFELGTVKGRHEMPVENFIFEEDITDFYIKSIEKHVDRYINNLIKNYIATHAPLLSEEQLKERCKFSISLYVTGLTPVTTSTIKACAKYNIGLTLFHYDIVDKVYQGQHMF